MLSQWALSAEVFEAVMLVCFGISWPVSILKMLRVRRVEGKSPLFLVLVLVGYAAGVAAKLLYAAAHQVAVQPVTALYALNGTMVLIDLLLYLKFRQAATTAPVQAQSPVA